MGNSRTQARSTSDLRARRSGELKIGDLERDTGVPRSTIHHYVRLGLLPPPRKLGPRLFLFDGQHVEALSRIRKLRDQERLSLKEIRARLRGRARPVSKDGRNADGNTRPEPDARQEAILKVATELFIQRGYRGVRLSDIAERLGLSKAALYSSFEGKEALFVACIDRIRLQIVPAAVRQAGARLSAGERSFTRTLAVLTNIEAYRMLTNLLVSVSEDSDERLSRAAKEALHRMVTNVVPDLQEAVDEGRYRKGNLELDAYMFWGALMAAGDYMSFAPGQSVAAIAHSFLDLITHGTLVRNASPDAKAAKARASTGSTRSPRRRAKKG